MNHPWQQPVRSLEFKYKRHDGDWAEWAPVLFVRPCNHGWEILSLNGVIHNSDRALLRFAA